MVCEIIVDFTCLCLSYSIYKISFLYLLHIYNLQSSRHFFSPKLLSIFIPHTHTHYKISLLVSKGIHSHPQLLLKYSSLNPAPHSVYATVALSLTNVKQLKFWLCAANVHQQKQQQTTPCSLPALTPFSYPSPLWDCCLGLVICQLAFMFRKLIFPLGAVRSNRERERGGGQLLQKVEFQSKDNLTYLFFSLTHSRRYIDRFGLSLKSANVINLRQLIEAILKCCGSEAAICSSFAATMG